MTRADPRTRSPPPLQNTSPFYVQTQHKTESPAHTATTTLPHSTTTATTQTISHYQNTITTQTTQSAGIHPSQITSTTTSNQTLPLTTPRPPAYRPITVDKRCKISNCVSPMCTAVLTTLPPPHLSSGSQLPAMPQGHVCVSHSVPKS